MAIEVPPKRYRPEHVAIIMDGNGRWAAEQGLERLEGHRRGATVVREITTYARELGLPYLTLYSFSRQNWRRPPAEVAGLMHLLESYCRDERDTLMEQEIRLRTIGSLKSVPPSTRRAVESVMAETAGNTKMTLTLAIDYGAREEMVSAVARMAADVREGKLQPEAVDEATVGRYLWTAGMPDPDLLIRTSGEMRISNFLLWQLSYSELYFTDVRWPVFGRGDFAAALRSFAHRQRRYGASETVEVGCVAVGELPGGGGGKGNADAAVAAAAEVAAEAAVAAGTAGVGVAGAVGARGPGARLELGV